MRWLKFPWQWRVQTPTPRPDLHILMYTRENCLLCDEAWHLLQDFQRRYGYALDAQNVDATAELRQAHGNWVPVVTINGVLRFRGRVNAVLLRRILDGPITSHEEAS